MTSATDGAQSTPPSSSASGDDEATGAGGADAGPGNVSTAGAGGEQAGSSVDGSAGTQAPVTCPSDVLAPGDNTRTLQVGGESREYILHVPNAYDGTSPVPLVVDFHPLGGSGSSERTGSPYSAQTDAEGVIMAFPTGKSGPSGGAWNVGPCCVANVDDVEFARALVADVEASACIDPKRVYAVGFSMGGGMSHYLACQAADLFAAVAPAAFDLLEENIEDCVPARPISVISFRGTSDPIVSYAGGYSAVVSGMPITFLGAEATFEKWAELNQCSGAASEEDGQGCKTYSECAEGTEVTLCTKQGGGHDPGNASVGWPALKRHTLP
jgi:polyhydroxybutyrate depolymerase